MDEILNLIESVSEGFPSYSFDPLVILCFLCCGIGVLMPILNKKMAAWLPWKQGNHSKMLAYYVAFLSLSCIECKKKNIYINKTVIPA